MKLERIDEGKPGEVGMYRITFYGWYDDTQTEIVVTAGTMENLVEAYEELKD